MMEKIKSYWQIIVIAVAVLGFGWWLRTIDADASGAKQKADRLETAILQLTEIVKHDNAKLEGFLTAMGMDPEKARKWSRMPKEPPADSAGNLLANAPWVRISEDLDIGVKIMVNDSGLVLVDTLWDFSESRK